MGLSYTNSRSDVPQRCAIPLGGDEEVSILGPENRPGGHDQGVLAVVGVVGLANPSLLEAVLAVAASSHKRIDDKTGDRPLDARDVVNVFGDEFPN